MQAVSELFTLKPRVSNFQSIFRTIANLNSILRRKIKSNIGKPRANCYFIISYFTSAEINLKYQI